MVLPLDALWFVVLILLMAIFCTAYLMSARVWLALILVVVVIGLALTVVSIIARRRREEAESIIIETEMLEYLKTHGIKGNLSELAEALNITQDDALWLLTSLEEQGTIPPGSIKAFGANLPDT
jgi:membrane protein implicated in regulation of membrane protease activity